MAFTSLEIAVTPTVDYNARHLNELLIYCFSICPPQPSCGLVSSHCASTPKLEKLTGGAKVRGKGLG
jgi:hypothetical protein